jgi:hypothetical protein
VMDGDKVINCHPSSEQFGSLPVAEWLYGALSQLGGQAH